MLDVKKRAGKNMVAAAEKIDDIVKDAIGKCISYKFKSYNC